MRILGISGSARRESHNTALLRAAALALPPGVELDLWDGVADLPIFSEDLEAGPAPAAVAELRSRVAAAGAILIATPEYNHAMPGGLKNALDWLSRPLATNPARGKPAAAIGASTGLFGAVWAQDQVRKVLGVLGAEVTDGELPIGQAASAFAADGTLADPEAADALAGLLAALTDAAREPALAA